MQNTVGLFGTCDSSTWREDFAIDPLNAAGVPWYNPNITDYDWGDPAKNAALVAEENDNLVNDTVILFPVLGESLGVGSLGEIGFSILSVLDHIADGNDQTLIVLIDDVCTDTTKTEAEVKTSNRTRKLVKSKLVQYLERHPDTENVYLVDTVEDMVQLAIEVHARYAA